MSRTQGQQVLPSCLSAFKKQLFRQKQQQCVTGIAQAAAKEGWGLCQDVSVLKATGQPTAGGAGGQYRGVPPTPRETTETKGARVAGQSAGRHKNTAETVWSMQSKQKTTEKETNLKQGRQYKRREPDLSEHVSADGGGIPAEGQGRTARARGHAATGSPPFT